jgi:hypothetical protein
MSCCAPPRLSHVDLSNEWRAKRDARQQLLVKVRARRRMAMQEQAKKEARGK